MVHRRRESFIAIEQPLEPHRHRIRRQSDPRPKVEVGVRYLVLDREVVRIEVRELLEGTDRGGPVPHREMVSRRVEPQIARRRAASHGQPARPLEQLGRLRPRLLRGPEDRLGQRAHRGQEHRILLDRAPVGRVRLPPLRPPIVQLRPQVMLQRGERSRIRRR